MFLIAILTFVTGESSDPFSACVSKRASRAGADFASMAIAVPESATRSSFGCWARTEKETATIIVAVATSRFILSLRIRRVAATVYSTNQQMSTGESQIHDQLL